ncbi:MAG: hypothetical protein J0L88_07980 [Xanthomonadales bacterium]|nr:hypothetical protein [Xanthomonadales bacterium]
MKTALRALGLAACLAAGSAHAQLGLSPSYLDLGEAEARRTQVFRVTNFGDQPVHVRTELAAFDIDARGEVAETAPNERSLERHLVISPIEFDIPARGSQAVRLALRPSGALVAGEYRGVVYFRLGAAASLGEGSQLPISYRLGGAVYVQVGEPVRTAVLEDIDTTDGREIGFSLRATGSANARLHGRYAVWRKGAWGNGQPLPPLPQENKPVPDGLVMNGALPGRPVLPGHRVRYATPLSQDEQRLPPGDYVVHVVGGLEQESIERVIPFHVAPARGDAAHAR